MCVCVVSVCTCVGVTLGNLALGQRSMALSDIQNSTVVPPGSGSGSGLGSGSGSGLGLGLGLGLVLGLGSALGLGLG